ncbi:BQ2448_7015 [Microbotryum intermedium]|uniref:polynucleotide adenylyltransferase n=1 Tax=Microbotryum intermedium TaxID=269621 RepID=A0A238FGZ9_9BASI|nr:BQ2448_7015 [Microbotryum intermedium]
MVQANSTTGAGTGTGTASGTDTGSSGEARGAQAMVGHHAPTSYVLAPELAHYLEHTLVPSVVPMPDEYDAKEQARIYLEKLADEVSHGAKLLPFGSMANGFALKNSDMDLCCVLAPDAPVRNAAELVETLGTRIEKETNFQVKMLPRARIPIIKLTIPPSSTLPFGMACDIGFENRLALENTRLLLTYAMIDPRLRTIVLFPRHPSLTVNASAVKVWTKRRKINNPYRGTLSSYGYVLLVIHFLTHVKSPPVLPNLQRLPPPRSISAEERQFQGHDVYFFDDLESLPRVWQTANVETVGELLIDFFRYYAKDFMYHHHVLSFRSEYGILTKEAKGWNTDVEYDPDVIVRDLHKLCIEDPFQLNYNVARTVTKDGLYTIRGEFMRAYRIIAPSRATDRITAVINDLCEEREDSLVIQPPSETRGSGRRRSAPSPRIVPTPFGSSMAPQPGYFGAPAPAVPPMPPMSDFRIWFATNGGLSASANNHEYDCSINGSALIDDSAPTSPILGLPAAAQPSPWGKPSGQAMASGTIPRGLSSHSTLQPATVNGPQRQSLRPTSSTLIGAEEATIERRMSWDGSASASKPPKGVYDLHRFFQNQPKESSSLGPEHRSAMTAPSSPDLSASAMYHSATFGGRGYSKGGRASLSAHSGTSSHVGPRFTSPSRSRAPALPAPYYAGGYPAIPPTWTYTYPIGTRPHPGPIFPEEDREQIALENSITFGTFPPSALSTSGPSSSSAGTATEGNGTGPRSHGSHALAWGSPGYEYPISSSSFTGVTPSQPMTTYDDVGDNGSASPLVQAAAAGHEGPGSGLTRGRILNGLPPLLPAPADEWEPASRPRQRGRSVSHVRFGPDGRESILFGEIQVTLPTPISNEVDTGDSLPHSRGHAAITNKVPRLIPSLTTSPPTPLRELNVVHAPSPAAKRNSLTIAATPQAPGSPPDLVPVSFATPSTILNHNFDSTTHPRESSSSASTTPTLGSPKTSPPRSTEMESSSAAVMTSPKAATTIPSGASAGAGYKLIDVTAMDLPMSKLAIGDQPEESSQR